MGPKKIILMAPGTAGDVFPFIGIGAAMAGRGYEVELLANAAFEETARQMGLGFVALGDVEDHERALAEPDLWTLRRGLSVVMENLVPDPLAAFDILMERVEPGRTVVVAHPLAMAARLAQESRRVPSVTAVLSTCWFRSLHRVPVIYGDRDLSSMARPLKSLMWALADRFLIDPVVTPPLNRARRRLGLAQIRRPFHEWIFSPLLTVGLFPDWFAPPQPDWPDTVRLTTFPNFHTTRQMSDRVERFFETGAAPIVFTPGSGACDVDTFVASAIDACADLDRRGIFLGTAARELTAVSDEPGRFLGAPFVPLDQLLPRAAALVHHGGVGTTSAALAAGIPQVVRPLAFDQPDHAARVEALGVGRCLLPRDFRAHTLSGILRDLLGDQTTEQTCSDLAGRLANEVPMNTICDAIEEAVREAIVEEEEGPGSESSSPGSFHLR